MEATKTKVEDLTKGIADTRSGVTDVKSFIDGMRSSRDTKVRNQVLDVYHLSLFSTQVNLVPRIVKESYTKMCMSLWDGTMGLKGYLERLITCSAPLPKTR